MKKTLAVCLAALLALCLLAGCGGQKSKLPDGMEATTVDTDAQAFVDAVNAQDWDGVVALYASETPAADEWEASLAPVLQALGEFKGYGDISYAVTEDQALGTLVNVLVEAEYAEQKVVWRVVMDTEYKIVGFWL